MTPKFLEGPRKHHQNKDWDDDDDPNVKIGYDNDDGWDDEWDDESNESDYNSKYDDF